MLKKETEEQKRRRLPIIILASYDDAHNSNNDYVLSGLANFGLIKGVDYDIYSISASMAEVVPVPIIKINEKNPWGLRSERFYGREGIDSLLDELRNRRAV